jgi:bacterioferritin (cytochrome b1)
MLTENELWLLSLYRASEIHGSLFFGRLAKVLRPGDIQIDLTKHYADEAQHAWYWTECIQDLGAQPLKLGEAYQDRYVSVTGLPANVMEVLAVTQVFEQRVVNQYAQHLRVPDVQPAVAKTLERIMEDERWHLKWVREALHSLEPEYGREAVQESLRRFREGDHEVYAHAMKEHEERLDELTPADPRG